MYPKFAWVILHLQYAHHGIKQSQKTNIRLSLPFHAKFYWLEFVVVWGFFGIRGYLSSLVMNSQ
jgi:hypothetical protein